MNTTLRLFSGIIVVLLMAALIIGALFQSITEERSSYTSTPTRPVTSTPITATSIMNGQTIPQMLESTPWGETPATAEPYYQIP